MKKFIFFAAALSVAASCGKNIETQPESLTQPNRIKVSVEQTKTEMSHSDGKFSFGWKAGDAVSLMEYVSEEMSFQSGASDPLTSDSKTAAFTVKMEPQSLGTGQKFHYVAVYPANDKFGIMGWMGTGADAYPILSIEIPTVQELPSNTSFDPASDIMVSNVKDASVRPEDLSLSLARVGGILQLHLTGLPKDGAVKYVEEGTVSVSGTSYCFGGSFLYYPGDTMIEPMSSGGGGGTSPQQIVFSAAPGVCPVVNEETDIFLRCCAGSLTGNVSLELVVNVDGEQHIFKKEFTVGSGSGTGSGTGTGGGTTAIGGSTGGGTGGTAVTIANGRITRMNILVEEDLTPDYIVAISGLGATEDKCGVEAEVIDVNGKGFSGMNAHVFYGTEPAATLEEFMGKSTYVSAGALPVDGKFFCEISGLKASTTYYIVVAVDDGKAMYSNDKVESFKTADPVSKPSVVFNAECKDGFVTIVGKVENFDCSGQYAYIHWDEGIKSDPTGINMRNGAPLDKDGSFSYVKEVSGTFSEGKIYSFCVSVNDGYTSYYSKVESIEIPGGETGDPKLTLSVGNFTTVTSGVRGTASGQVLESSLFGKVVYIYMADGTVTDVSKMSKKTGKSSDKTTGSYSIYVMPLTNGKTYSFCAGVEDGKGSTYFSEIKTVTVSTGK